MIVRMTPLAHQQVLPFFQVNTYQDENERCGRNLLEASSTNGLLDEGGDVRRRLFSLLCPARV